uniref:Transposase n=1 Tax=Romanomermis culicivorax TaxID=13658 RepID=A0A915KUZ8_ROMCU
MRFFYEASQVFSSKTGYNAENGLRTKMEVALSIIAKLWCHMLTHWHEWLQYPWMPKDGKDSMLNASLQ